ncbi:MAG: carbamoyl phosphate synthase small subunit, partial [Clostridia bacterium]
YAVVGGSLDPKVAQVSHINVNDQTVEGVRYLNIPAFTVQFHPESKPGPRDMEYIFDEFIAMMGGTRNA